MNPVFVSGATGYIGGAICRTLAAAGLSVTGGLRTPAALPAGVTPLITGDLAAAAPNLTGFTAVIHAAGLGHRRGVTPEAWRRANVDAAVNLARAAAAAGAQKFILISTAHVHGRVHAGIVTDETPANPMDHYAASKLQAERAVAAVFGENLVIIRPAAVVGPACPGNLQLLMALLRRRIPLPFAAIANRRAFIQVDDLARLTLTGLTAETTPTPILAAHPEPISTPALIRALAAGMNIRPILLPCPPAALAAAARLAGRTPIWQSLAGDFIAAPRAALALGWFPSQSLTDSLIKTGAAYTVS